MIGREDAKATRVESVAFDAKYNVASALCRWPIRRLGTGEWAQFRAQSTRC